MIIRFELEDGAQVEITTEHPQSSYGQPVLLIDGKLTDGQVFYRPDPPERPSPLDLLADAANIHDGPVTRNKLNDPANEMLADTEHPSGADYDRVIAKFKARGREMADT